MRGFLGGGGAVVAGGVGGGGGGIAALVESPITGPEGNVEFLIAATRDDPAAQGEN